jgi:hypothetical protein
MSEPQEREGMMRRSEKKFDLFSQTFSARDILGLDNFCSGILYLKIYFAFGQF